MDSTAQATPMASEISTKNLFPTDSEIIDETASTTDTWIGQRIQLLWHKKSSPKTLSLLP
jgi:hypothetical protein